MFTSNAHHELGSWLTDLVNVGTTVYSAVQQKKVVSKEKATAEQQLKEMQEIKQMQDKVFAAQADQRAAEAKAGINVLGMDINTLMIVGGVATIGILLMSNRR